jgi:Fur family ferric uptake transcriptional regulator
VRIGVLETLDRARGPISVPQILGRLRGVDTVTVYRTLNTFVRKKLVHRIRGEDRGWRYALSTDSATPEHRHPHFVCDDCGRVECLEQAEIPVDMVSAMGVGREYRVSYPEVVLHGKCPRCQA